MTNSRPRRRYQFADSEMNRLTDELIARVQELYGEHEGAEHARQLLVTSLKLVQDRTEVGDVKLLNNAMKELRHSMRVFGPFRHIRKVAAFGSARTKPEEAAWKQAYEFSERIVKAGWMVITGAGPGIMEAAQGGAGRMRSFGVNIRLPFEQEANETIRGDHKLVNFRYFFTRKVSFVKESHAIVCFPGGFGTHDEGLETLTLIQTGKSELVPVVFVDDPGGSYWEDWLEYVERHLVGGGLISPDDRHLFMRTDSVDDAVHEVLNYYSNYHSSRYVGDKLVLRVRHAPNEEALDELNANFGDIVTEGKIEVTPPLAGERGEVEQFARICFGFDRRSFGQLRLLVNRLNDLVPDEASSPAQASPHEIRATEVSDEAAAEEEDD